MNTNTQDGSKAPVTVLRTAAASVIGARHIRIAKNGQDATGVWVSGDAAAAVVCDGCGSRPSSEVGARLGAQLVIRAIATRVGSGLRGAALWEAVRGDVGHAIAIVVDQLPGDRATVIHDHFLFTIVAGLVTRDEAAVWMLGDGAYAFGERTQVIGPFADNQPPYIAYDLLGDRQPAHFELASPQSVVIATDGAREVGDLGRFATARFVYHPDALRRHLAVLARPRERIDWNERRVVRTPALLQDDCAIGVLLREAV